MLHRVPSFLEFFQIDPDQRRHAMDLVHTTAERSKGMMHVNDLEALAGLLLSHKPKLIFEIGTYLGNTSDFMLQLLPESRVVSIAYVNPAMRLFGKSYNNSELAREQVGSMIDASRRSRFTQLYGDSHKLEAPKLVAQFGRFDMMFVDGDHSGAGVKQDTKLAMGMLAENGLLAWHDANPKPKYTDVRAYLENELEFIAMATADTFIGGVAAWSRDITQRLGRLS